MIATISPQRRREIIDALRRGTVPRNGLDAFSVGLEIYDAVLDAELASVKAGGRDCPRPTRPETPCATS